MLSVKRINLWSGPRNISTALMYSFAQRDDTKVLDEPLYAHYLRETGLQHPGREEILQSQEQDGYKVIRNTILGHCDKPVLFCKQMTHHLISLEPDFLSQTYNLLLIRDPKRVLISYAKVIAEPTISDIGIRQSFDLYHLLAARNYHRLVIDSNEVLQNPRLMLQAVCDHIGLSFQSAMLQWKAGARSEDGVWARHWYDSVHRSTGFASPEEESGVLPEKLQRIYMEAKPYYDFLYDHSISH